ncbi:MAG: bifunctional (p)ppGpp synthetase/guanosine-3',5'-bis(diphosphate) 3'-pyrophosphohydrolase [Verrucomicrobia bacterium]|nr:bifunctional (p)ppGpp synthetase/guanosine-3',5'-bis(diphosphate) 3'-pyrophosphohydrolase [Verrucomicrobiota bacterium]MBV8485084.1 bifunctional (p)ppGpp synthetase/guanosine-3',5'-bis(diphosphate) 3'-pyrophosphohydrolase [Verrucomicrobiota bacterium]
MAKTLVQKARRFAKLAHGLVLNNEGELGQQRKGTHEPYSKHLSEVARLVAKSGGDEAQIAAAWLHDVVEDTPVPLSQIRRVFGPDIAKLVLELTDKFTKQNYPGLNRRQRKAKELDRLSKISDRAKTIKYADFVSNLESVSVLGPNFSEVYTREIADALSLMQGGDEGLRSAALAAVDHALR